MPNGNKISFFIVFASVLVACPQSQREREPDFGIIVESLQPHLEGDRVGLQKDDLILNWARGASKGAIRSPFDLAEIEIEQAPRGAITLEGKRGAEYRRWILGQDAWGIKARPFMHAGLLAIYQENESQIGNASQIAVAWERAVNKIQPAQSQWMTPWLLLHSAEARASAKSWREADDLYRLAVRYALKAGPEITVKVFRSWCATFEVRNDWTGAQRCYGRALEHAKNLNDQLVLAAILDDFGQAAWSCSELSCAKKYYGRALNLREKLVPQSLVTARSLNHAGHTAGDAEARKPYFSRALGIAESLAPDGLDVADSLRHLAVVVWIRGDLEQCEELLNRARTITQNVEPGGLHAAFSLEDVAVVEEIRGRLDAAERDHLQALVILQTLRPASGNIANILNNLGDLFQDLGDLEKARKYHLQSLRFRRKHGPADLHGIAMSLSNLGIVEQKSGNLRGAEHYQHLALKLFGRGNLDSANTVSILGELAQARGDLNLAGRRYRQALGIRNKLSPKSLNVAESLNNLGQLSAQRGDLFTAEKYLRDALAIRDELAPGSKVRAETLAALASVMRRKGQLEDASRFYEQALNTLENQVSHLGGADEIRSRFRAGYNKYYLDYVDLLMALHQPERAFEVQERWRSRALLEMLEVAKIDIRHGVNASLIQQEQSLLATIEAKSSYRLSLRGNPQAQDQVAAVTREIESLRDQLQDVQSQIRISSPAYAALTRPRALSVKEVQALLDEDTVLLEYGLGAQRCHLWLVSANSFAAYDLAGDASIEKVVQELRTSMTARNIERRAETAPQRAARLSRAERASWVAATQLSRLVLGPAWAQLEGKRLLIASDGPLYYVPFAMLPLPGSSLQAGKLLVEEHEVVPLPSASVLAQLRQRAASRNPAPKAVAVLADPVFDAQDRRVTSRHPLLQPVSLSHLRSVADKGDLTRAASDVGLLQMPRLQATRAEADAIIALASPGQSKKALDFDANRDLVLSGALAQYRIVHFATHALLDSKNPELSGLVLSLVDQAGKPQAGFLQLQDIYNLNLPVDLVVLSGCDTALGKEVRGEGLIGLTRGFMYAGASRVVASLWSVQDTATKELMENFYRAMQQEGMPPAAALRRAQIAMLSSKRWADPYYWAAFQIQGEWK